VTEQYGEIVTAEQPVAGARCQVCLDVRPFGFTLLAQVRWDGPAALPGPDEPELSTPEGLILVGLVDQIIQRLREEDAERARLETENSRLRQALQECVTACGRFLGTTSDEVPLDSFEADRAVAHHALEVARQALAGPPVAVG
jgi:hypothetical protein